MQVHMKKYIENRIRLDPDVNRSLDYYISEIMVDAKPGERNLRNTVVTDVMKEFLEKSGILE